MSHKSFRPLFFRADEALRSGEVINKINFEQTLKTLLSDNSFKTKKSLIPNTYLFPFKTNQESNFLVECNYDMGIYENSMFLVNKDFLATNTISLIGNPGESILVVTSQHFKAPQPIKNLPLVAGASNVRAAAICFMSAPKSGPIKESVSLVSTDERDPGQHLFHMLKENTPDALTFENLDHIIQGPRHLFLSNPVRLIVESRRTSPKQMNELMKLDIPTYHSLWLGKIWGNLSSLTNPSANTFILDEEKARIFSMQLKVLGMASEKHFTFTISPEDYCLSLLDLLLKLNFPVAYSCHGKKICKTCKVTIIYINHAQQEVRIADALSCAYVVQELVAEKISTSSIQVEINYL